MLLARLMFLAMICYQNVLCDKKGFCGFDDTNCLTAGAQKCYLECVKGDSKGVPSSDPIHVDHVKADLPTIKYTMNNVTFSGMKSCSPSLVQISTSDNMFNYHVACRHLTVSGVYEANGKFGSLHLNGNGNFRTELYNYVLLFNGGLEYHFDREDNLYIQIKYYKLNLEARGKIEYDFKNLYNGDEEKSIELLKYANEHWEEVDKLIRQPLMEKILAVFIRNVNSYMNIVTVEYMFPRND